MKLGTKAVEGYIMKQEKPRRKKDIVEIHERERERFGVTVGLEKDLLDSEEIAVLKRGPKFSCRRVLCKERFLVEMEKCACKIRWSKRDEDMEDAKNEENETTEERKERKRVEKIAEEEAIRYLLVFYEDELEIAYRKRRWLHHENLIGHNFSAWSKSKT